jgi:hypothetical protein
VRRGAVSPAGVSLMGSGAKAPAAPAAGKVKLTREQSRRVREMMTDEGHTRAEAVAWVLAFEPGVTQ